jgi:uncharacterized protein YcfJ
MTPLRRPVSRLPLVALAVACALGAPAAHADRWQKKHRDHGPYPVVHDRDRGAEYDFARVVDVQPRVTRVRVEEPRRECWQETRYEPPAPRPGVAGPMVLGGIVGGALGNQIGRGDGRRAATVAGAIIGSAIGHDVGERRRDRDYDPEPRAYAVEQCDTRWESRWDERVDGYDVEYEYGGRRFRTTLPYDPGDRMRVRVAVSPAEG